MKDPEIIPVAVIKSQEQTRFAWIIRNSFPILPDPYPFCSSPSAPASAALTVSVTTEAMERSNREDTTNSPVEGSKEKKDLS